MSRWKYIEVEVEEREEGKAKVEWKKIRSNKKINKNK